MNLRWMYKFICFFAFFSCFIQFISAQSNTDPNSKVINVISADTLSFRKTNDTTNLKVLSGHVIVKQQTTTFYCDSAILNELNNTLEAFGHVHINNADSVHTYADYLRYIGNDKTAFLRRNVRLTDGRGTLTTPELDYNTQTKIGIYRQAMKAFITGRRAMPLLKSMLLLSILTIMLLPILCFITHTATLPPSPCLQKL